MTTVRNITTNYTLTPADFQPASISAISVSAASAPVILTLPRTDTLTGAAIDIAITDATNAVWLTSPTANIETGTRTDPLGLDYIVAIASQGTPTPVSVFPFETAGIWYLAW